MFLISYALDPTNWSSNGFDFEEEDSLLEAIIPASYASSREPCAAAYWKATGPRKRPLMTVRGRLRIGEQLRKTVRCRATR